MYCRNCGKQQPANNKFCSCCGSPLSAPKEPVEEPVVAKTSAPEPVSASKPASDTNRNQHLWLIISIAAVVIVVLGVIIGILLSGQSKGDGKPVATPTSDVATGTNQGNGENPQDIPSGTATPTATPSPTPTATPTPSPTSMYSAADEVKARAAVDNFMNALCSYDVEKAASYTNNPALVKMLVPFSSEEEMVAGYMKSIPPELQKYEAALNDYINTVISVMKDKTTYKINSLTFAEDGFHAKIEYTTIDGSDSSMQKITEKMSKEITMENLANELIISGKINDQMSEEEIMDVFVPYAMEQMSDFVKNSDFKTNTQTLECKIVKSGGKWLLEI